MERKFKPGDIAYVSVEVCEDKPADWDYNVKVSDKGGGSLKFCVNEGELFSLADFGTSNGIDWQATYNEYSEKARRTIADLSKRITELNALLKETQAKADNLNSALKSQNNANLELEDKNALQARKVRELEEKLSNGKGDVEHWRKKYMGMKATCNEHKRFVSNVEAERDYAEKELALTKIMNIALAEKIERMQNG